MSKHHPAGRGEPHPASSPLAIRASGISSVSGRADGGRGPVSGGGMTSPFRPRPTSAVAPPRSDLVSPQRMPTRPASAVVPAAASKGGAGMLSPMRGVAMGKDAMRAMVSPMRSPLNRTPARRVFAGDSAAARPAPAAGGASLAGEAESRPRGL